MRKFAIFVDIDEGRLSESGESIPDVICKAFPEGGAIQQRGGSELEYYKEDVLREYRRNTLVGKIGQFLWNIPMPYLGSNKDLNEVQVCADNGSIHGNGYNYLSGVMDFWMVLNGKQYSEKILLGWRERWLISSAETKGLGRRNDVLNQIQSEKCRVWEEKIRRLYGDNGRE